jgi:NADH-quinone oxidoreductase subunit M
VSLWPFSHWITAVAVGGVVISAVYGLRAAARVFYGPPTERFREVAAQHPPADLEWSERLPALILFALLIFIGFWPRAISDAANQALGARPVAPTATVSFHR